LFGMCGENHLMRWSSCRHRKSFIICIQSMVVYLLCLLYLLEKPKYMKHEELKYLK